MSVTIYIIFIIFMFIVFCRYFALAVFSHYLRHSAVNLPNFQFFE